MDCPILTFNQWKTILIQWNDIECYYYPEPELGKRFSRLASSLQKFGLASPEHDSYGELASLAQYWLGTHYIIDLPPRQDARQYWNLWKHSYGTHLEKYYTSGFDNEWMRPGYIYVLKMGDWYKIGRTDNIMRRFPQIHVKQPLPTYLWCLFYVMDMYEEEQLLHQYYAPLNTNGEWFKLSFNDACALHSLQPAACGHIYMRYKRLHAKWRQANWDEWHDYYQAYIKKANEDFQRTTQ
jgi:hypothetical protein